MTVSRSRAGASTSQGTVRSSSACTSGGRARLGSMRRGFAWGFVRRRRGARQVQRHACVRSRPASLSPAGLAFPAGLDRLVWVPPPWPTARTLVRHTRGSLTNPRQAGRAAPLQRAPLASFACRCAGCARREGAASPARQLPPAACGARRGGAPATWPTPLPTQHPRTLVSAHLHRPRHPTRPASWPAGPAARQLGAPTAAAPGRLWPDQTPARRAGAGRG